MIDTDRDWEVFAREDAYFSVLTEPEYRQLTDDENGRDRFFATGEKYVEELACDLSRLTPGPLQELRALDFGCGVGRLLIPMARRFEHVTGVDVSKTMLAEARRNISAFGLTNAEALTLEQIAPGTTFDLVHSYLVFQHIPPKQGLRLLEDLLRRLNPGGLVALHFTFARDYRHSAAGWRLASRHPSLIPLFRLLKGENPFRRRMLMMRYDLNEILQLLRRHRVVRTRVAIVDDRGNLGAMILGRAD